MRAAPWIAASLVGLGTLAIEATAADAAGRYPARPARIVLGSTPDVLAPPIGANLGES